MGQDYALRQMAHRTTMGRDFGIIIHFHGLSVGDYPALERTIDFLNYANGEYIAIMLSRLSIQRQGLKKQQNG